MRAMIASRYAGREYLLSFAVAFAFFFVVFFVNQILLMAEDILSRRAPLGQVLLLLLYSLPSIVAISAPFSSLGGALMAAGRLGADNEILAMAACGIRTRSVFAPFVAVGLAISVLSFVANDFFLPLGTIEFGRLYRRLVGESAMIELQPWSVRRYERATIVTGPRKDGGLADVVVFDKGDELGRRVLSADFARLEVLEGGFDAILHLEGVLEHRKETGQGTGQGERFTVTKAGSLEYRIAIKEKVQGLSGTGPAEMSSRDLLALVKARQAALDGRIEDRRIEVLRAGSMLGRRYTEAVSGSDIQPQALEKAMANLKAASGQKPQDRTLQVFRLELQKKFSIPAAAFFFAFLAFPLGIGARKAGRTAGFGMGLLLAVIYWSLLLAGQTLGVRMGIDPFIAMWMPNLAVAFAAGVAWLLRRLASRGVL